MKKMFAVFGVVLAFLVACSGSDSGGATQPCNDASCLNSKNNASKCDLATQKLPTSSLAWQPTLSGGCEAQQQIALDEMLKFDTLLIASGFQKEELVQESYRYVRDASDYTTFISVNDTLTFTYTMGTFVGNFRSVTAPMSDRDLQKKFVTSACPVLLPPEALSRNKVCSSVTENGIVFVNSVSTYKSLDEIESDLAKYGWSCLGTDLVICSATYDSQNYTLSFRVGVSGPVDLVFKWDR